MTPHLKSSKKKNNTDINANRKLATPAHDNTKLSGTPKVTTPNEKTPVKPTPTNKPLKTPAYSLKTISPATIKNPYKKNNIQNYGKLLHEFSQPNGLRSGLDYIALI